MPIAPTQLNLNQRVSAPGTITILRWSTAFSVSAARSSCIGEPFFSIKPHRVLDCDEHMDSDHPAEANHPTDIEQTVSLTMQLHPGFRQDGQVTKLHRHATLGWSHAPPGA